MSRFALATVCAVLLLGLPAAAQHPVEAPGLAPVKMGFLNYQRLLAESSEGKAATAKIRALTEQKTAELTAKAKALETAQQKLETLNGPERLQAQKDASRMNVELARLKEDAGKEVQALQQELFGPVQEKVRATLNVMLKELDIQVLFNGAQALAFLVDPKLDITDAVLKRLEADANKPATPAKP